MQGQPYQIGYPSGRQAYYKFDAAGRVNGLSANANWQWSTYYSSCPNGTPDLVAGATYNKAGQLTATDFGGSVTETRTYNNLLQLTRIQAGLMDLSYLYPDGANNGRISAEVNNLTNTRVDYGYDQLNRLSGAVSSSGGTTNWGLSFGYDVYGNRTGQTVTAGTAPQFAAQFDNSNHMTAPATSYDANGNQLTTPDGAVLEYDWDNRMTKWTRGTDGTERYHYAPSGARVLKESTAGYGSSTLYLYGPGGQLLSDSSGKDYVYFGGRLAYTMEPGWAGGCSARTRVYGDRLGTVRASEPLLGAITTRSFYPFGEEIGTPSPNDQYKFASTYRDSTTGLDYALNRYLSSGMGRFLSADPSEPGALGDPQSLNLYNYVLGDPINYNDPDGLDVNVPLVPGGIATSCLNTTIIPMASRLGFPTEDNLNGFFNSSAGVLGLTLFFEDNRGSVTEYQAISQVMANRYHLDPTFARDAGIPQGSFAQVVRGSSGVWSGSNLAGNREDQLIDILNASTQTTMGAANCQSLERALNVAADAVNTIVPSNSQTHWVVSSDTLYFYNKGTPSPVNHTYWNYEVNNNIPGPFAFERIWRKPPAPRGPRVPRPDRPDRPRPGQPSTL